MVNKFRHRTIGRKLIISVMVITMLSSLMIIGTVMSRVSQSLEREIDKKLVAITERYGIEVELSLRDVQHITAALEVELISRLQSQPITKHSVDQALGEIEPLVKMLAQSSDQGSTAYMYIDPELTGDVHDIYYADQDGDGIVERQKELQKSFYENTSADDLDKEWWFGPQRTGQPYWTQPYDWQLDNGESLTFVSYIKPVYINDEFIGIVGSDVLYDELFKLIKSTEVYSGGFSYLLNSEGDFLIYPKGEPVLLDNIHDQFIIEKVDISPQDSAVQYRITNGRHEYFSSVVTLSNGWQFGIAINSDIVFKELKETVNIMIFITLLVAFFVGIAFYKVGKSIGQPIVELANYVDDLESSDYQDVVFLDKEYPYVEVKRLSRAIMQMLERIRSNVHQMHTQNIALKKEITKNEEMHKKLEVAFEALSNSSDGILILDKAFQIIYYNQTLLGQFELTKETIDAQLLDLFPIEIQNESLFELSQWHIRRQGSLSTMNIRATLHDLGDDGDVYLAIYRDITSDISQQNKIEEIKMRDLLTGLYNRQGFAKEIELFLINSISGQYPLLLVNIDDFRSINDSIGFQSANNFLKKIAEVLSTIFGDKSIIARTNGDEYGIFIKKNFEDQAIKSQLAAFVDQIGHMYEIDNGKIYFNYSVGVSVIGLDSKDQSQGMNNAHSALKYAKDSDQDCLVFFSREVMDTTIEHYQMVQGLREAIEQRSFEVAYQPKWDTKLEKCVGLEALARWRWRDDYIRPDVFIRIAEQNNLMIEIGEIIFEKAVIFIKELSDKGIAVPVSINVSGVQFKKDYFDNFLFETIDKFGIDPSLIEIELTESILMLNHIESSGLIALLREKGIQSSLDDFGKGYSSLSYLKNFKVNTIKVDRDFIRDIPENDEGTLAELIINLGKMFGFKVVAEGVETKEQLDFVNTVGCHIIQGYYFSRPLAEEEVENWLEKHM